ncbi:Fur family zinc uptake regulator [Luteococcus japonicus]|uniref:Zinc uptake regulation protein ZUR n=2 Tax=Luteococcus japonicus TaxID=33984 RepID=A0A1R4K7U7_9ACTN|nr:MULTISPECIES: Fur family transcriptional regulator [Luteococcus]MDN5562426.1 transcriptional repressor [Luteococcus sp.]ROR53176.1 Fur family zinc uptake regulator [Luteococcus japonicus]SJN40192.1 Zinc uptake regulation protein ZUR [Luteococcus japonicus LSP_Lj1]
MSTETTSSKGRPAQRVTRQRLAIRALLTDIDGFRSAQQLHEELREAGDSVGLATVYRTLQAMAESGEVDGIRTDDGEMVYRQCSQGHHHHLVCRECGRTVEISAKLVEQWAQTVATEHGFRDAGHEIELFGLCSDC